MSNDIDLVAYVKGLKILNSEDKSGSVAGTTNEEDDEVHDEDDEDHDDEMDEDADSAADEEDGDEPEIPDEPIRTVRLRHSRFPNRAPTIVFDYPKRIKVKARDEEYPEHRDRIEIVTVPSSSKTKDKTKKIDERTVRLRYKTQWERNSIKNAFKKAGFERTTLKGSKWSAAWIKHPKGKFKKLKPHQRVNHFPDSWVIGNKSRLMRCIEDMQSRFGAAYEFIPEGYSWPAQKDAFLEAVEQEPSSLWILKPPSASRGRGIRVIQPHQLDTIPPKKKFIIQKYIANPLLIDGHKFDIRLYVLVTSINPLRIYLFQEGFVRFCTAKYSLDPEHLSNRYGHLTNYSVNCKNVAFERNKDAFEDGQGSKWSLTALYARLDAEGFTTDAATEIMTPIQDIIIKTLIGAEGHLTPLVEKTVPYRNNCYELFGFDLMLDADLKPWLIEVNISPSLMGSSPLDQRIKGTLMADIYNLVGFQYPTPEEEGTPPTVDSPSSKTENDKGKRTSKKLPVWKSSGNGPFSNALDRELDAQQIEALTDKDWEIILDYEEEMERTGHFTCLFPTSETLAKYQQFFTVPRYHNTLCGRWLRYKKKHRVSYRPSKSTTDIASYWKSKFPIPSPIKKLASASKMLGGHGSKQKVGLVAA